MSGWGRLGVVLFRCLFSGGGARVDGWGEKADGEGWRNGGMRRGGAVNPWATPNALWVTAGAAEGSTELNAFDNALLEAGIGDVNLVRVSSIVPPGAELLETPPELRPGSLVPAVYSEVHGATAGETICAALGIGVGKDSHGMIFEHSATSREVAEPVVTAMVKEAFARRGLPLERLVVCVAEHRVERVGCAVAAVVLWWR
jgi:arginine decarboxylase